MENQEQITQEVLTAKPAFEIAPGMTAEEIKAEFFDADALQEQPEPVYRLDSSGHRYYYTFDENGEPKFYVSVTTLIKQTLPTSPQLIKWIADMGYDESQRYAAERAAYGTFMHAQIGELLITKCYDLDSLRDRLKSYIESEKLPSDFINYADDLKKDLLAFAQFAKDVDLKPLAIEIVLTNKRDNYAGAIDLVAEITIEEKGFFGEYYKTGAKAGEPKETKRQRRVRAIIDFKSGRKGFFPEHEVQLAAYQIMWNMNFEQYPVEKLYNWSPKDWRGKTPSYNLKDQTESKNAKKLPYLIELARIEDEKRDNTIVSCNGVIELGTTDLADNITELSLAEVVKKHKERQETPDGDVKPADAVTEGNEPEAMSCKCFIDRINGDLMNYSLWDTTGIAAANGVELVDEGLNLDQHRWYSIATNIYKCSDGYVKVTGAYQSFSEHQMWSDIDVHSQAYLLTGNELKAFELRQQAKAIENEPADKAEETKNEPKNSPSDEQKKAKEKATRKADKKPAERKETAKKAKNNVSALLDNDLDL